MAVVTMTKLLESGVHFGHQTRRWDPRMKPYIFTERNGIHIIDLQQTTALIKEAFEAVRRAILANKSILFVGTKKQAQQAIRAEAENCNMFYVNHRWLGGTLTNFTTIKSSLFRLKKLEKMEIDGTYESLTKKEVAKFNKERQRLERNLGGIKEMKELPGIVFVIDPRKEAIPVSEARRMKIPVVAVVDTNCNPETIDYPIPGNDDAIRAISLFTQIIARAVIEADNEIGLEVIDALHDDEKESDVSTVSRVASGRDVDQEAEEAIAEQEGMDEWKTLARELKEERQSPRRLGRRNVSDSPGGPKRSADDGPAATNTESAESGESTELSPPGREPVDQVAETTESESPKPLVRTEEKKADRAPVQSKRMAIDEKPIDTEPTDTESNEKPEQPPQEADKPKAAGKPERLAASSVKRSPKTKAKIDAVKADELETAAEAPSEKMSETKSETGPATKTVAAETAPDVKQD